MQIIITILYALSGLLSLWGAFKPWYDARAQASMATRAQAAAQALDDAVKNARASGDEQAELDARAVQTARGQESFEGGSATLNQWTQPVQFGGGTTASRAVAEKASRQRGLGFIALGVAMGAVASILSLWCLPA